MAPGSKEPWEKWDYWKKGKTIVLGVLDLGRNGIFLNLGVMSLVRKKSTWE